MARQTQLEQIVRSAGHITSVCANTSPAANFVPLRPVNEDARFECNGSNDEIACLVDSMPVDIRDSILRMWNERIESFKHYIKSLLSETRHRLVSVGDVQGRDDESTDKLVIAAFQREFDTQVVALLAVVRQAVARYHDQQVWERCTTGFSTVLETAFQRKDTLNNAETVALSQMSGITPHQVRTWFQNRRNRARKNARKAGSASKTPLPLPPPPPPSTATTTDSSARPVSALPRRGQKPPLSYSSLATPHLNMDKTTPDATGTGRRVRAMPKRAFPPTSQKPKAFQPAFAYSTLNTPATEGISPSPSMARSLSAHSSDGSISSEDPSGGFNSLLNPPLDAPPQVSLSVPQEDWGIDWSWPAVAGFGMGGMNLELDMGMFNFGAMEVGLPMQQTELDSSGGMEGLGGVGLGSIRSDGTGGLGAMGELTLTGPSSSTGYLLDGTKDHQSADGIQGGVDQGDSLDWLKFLQWDDEELAEGVKEPAPNDAVVKGKEAEEIMSQQEVMVSPVDVSPTRSHSGSSSRSLTPPPLPQNAHFFSTLTRSGATAHPSHVDPVEAIDASHFVPSQRVPQHYFHSHPAQYAHQDGYDSPSRIPSYGSVASTTSTRIITPPSAEFYTAHTGQYQNTSVTHPGQSDTVSKHNRTQSGEGLKKVSSWTAPSLDQVAERSTANTIEQKDQPQVLHGQPIYRLESYYPLRVDENAHPALAAPAGMVYPALFQGSGQALHPQDPNLYFHPSHPSHPSQPTTAHPVDHRQYFPVHPTISPTPRSGPNMTIPISSSRSTDISQSSGSSSPPVQSAHTSPVQSQGKVQVQAHEPTPEMTSEQMGGEWISGVMPFEGTYSGDWSWQDQA